ncbi:hypothetical protein JCM17844_07030 [Iodidimonas gelatinilytica]|uniref:Head-tail adaptor protein n=1 Tax=Iodidimonas gelatinilytica TaxID=1236966 RepID=A0A5A7MMJ7_9PROT|nr:phage head closure protein [Iodidimonas gelatinilytica]GEQ97066.1 hypothetical protein JCM17844_07030 [Iodidimonas gelatinilytica]
MSGELDAGRLDQRVEHQRPHWLTDEAGAPVESWEGLGRLWATVVPLGAEDPLSADRPHNRVRYRLIIRALADMRPGDRVLWRGRALDIRSIAPHAADTTFLTLGCEERLP